MNDESNQKNENVNNQNETNKKVNPFVFVKNDLIEVKIVVVYDNDGNLVSILSDEFFNIRESLQELRSEEFVFKFSTVNYDKLNKYRQKCIETDKVKNIQIINTLKLRDFFIIYHLREWNLKDENGNIIKLQFDPNNALSDESIELVYSLHPSILDIVITTFEKKMLLS